MKRIEDKILWFCLIIFTAYLIALLLMGCATKQSAINLIWHDGQCLLFVEGISAEQAGNMSKEWEFGECEIKVESELGTGEEDSAVADGLEGV
jgi:uncharacterized lipoprotein NlpE involved in copper resistance